MAFSIFGKRPTEPQQPTAPEPQEPRRGLFDRMKQAVTRTRESFTESISSIVALTREVDETTLLNLEPLLLAADLGAPTTAIVMESLRQRALRTGIQGGDELKQLLKSELKQILDSVARPIRHPAAAPEVIMMVGVNGTGKTTTTGKLAAYFTAGNKKREFGDWEVTTARANATLHLMISHGVGETQVRKVAGFADTQPIEGVPPTDPRNRRVAVLLKIAGRKNEL